MMFQELNKKEKLNKRSKTTRSSIFLFALLTLFVVGCSEQSSVLAPNNVNTNEPNWISLPNMNGESGMSVMSMPIFQASKKINGEKGGSISINESYSNRQSGNITVNAELVFPKGAFDGSKDITMILDTQYGSATFSPHSEFKIDAIFSAEFTGLDLTGVKSNDVDFVYQDKSGKYEKIDRSNLEVDVKKGILKVVNAKLPHFSRYGFVR